MTDDDVRGRNDILVPPEPRSASLPPALKVSREIGFVVVELNVLWATVLCTKWGEVPGHVLAGVLTMILAANYALRKGAGAMDVQSLVALLRR